MLTFLALWPLSQLGHCVTLQFAACSSTQPPVSHLGRELLGPISQSPMSVTSGKSKWNRKCSSASSPCCWWPQASWQKVSVHQLLPKWKGTACVLMRVREAEVQRTLTWSSEWVLCPPVLLALSASNCFSACLSGSYLASRFSLGPQLLCFCL